MDDDIDKAIETAARHAREAAERLRETPVESPEIVEEAEVVHHRAEDVEILATDAAKEADAQE